jgi:uncharacterized protein
VDVPPRPDRFEDDTTAVPPATWRPWEAVGIFVVALVLAGVADILLQQVVTSCQGTYLVQVAAGELGLGVAVLGWVRVVDHAPFAALGLPRRPVGDLGVGVLAGAMLVVVGDAALVLVRELVILVSGHAPSQPNQVVACIRGGWVWAIAPAVILAAPLGEELFFRGYLYKSLRRRMPVWGAAVVSGVVFGASHFAGVDFLTLIPGLAVVGVGLALVYERRQSLLASMAAHATFNVVGILAIALSRR